MINDITNQYNQFLNSLAEELDIPPSKYLQAVQRYTAVGNWLEEEKYEGSVGTPQIYPQGSFRLGELGGFDFCNAYNTIVL